MLDSIIWYRKRISDSNSGNCDRSSRNGGFTLIELIIVIAVMTILGWMIVPAWGRYVNSNKKVACRHNRENLLKIYERCLYDSSVEIFAETDDISKVVDGTYGITAAEVSEYKNCPYENDTTTKDYKAFIKTNADASGKVNSIVAIIHCDRCGDDISVALESGWQGQAYLAQIDRPISPIVNPPRVPGEDDPDPLDPEATPTPPRNVVSWPVTSGKGSADWWLDLTKLSDEDRVYYEDLWKSNGFSEFNLSGDKSGWYYDMPKPSGIIEAYGTNDRFVYIDNPSARDKYPGGGREQRIWYVEEDGTTLGDIYSYSAMHPYWMVKLTGLEHVYDADDYFAQYGGRYYKNEKYDKNKPENGPEFLEYPLPIAAHSNGDLIKIKINGKVYTYVYYSEDFDLWGLFLSCTRVEKLENDPTDYDDVMVGSQCLYRVDF